MIGRGSYAPLQHPSGPIVLVDEICYCDGGPEHEIRVITDGRRAYAYGTARGASDAGQAWREGTVLTANCAQPGRDEFPCDGVVRVDLTGDVWTAADQNRIALLQLGTAVEW